MRIYLGSLGCKLNQAEMDALAAQLAQAGHEVAHSPAEADLCVLNTCAVTHVAAQKSRQALRRLHRDNPRARLVATGCYAELAPDLLRDLPGVAQVAGNQAKEGLASLLGGQDHDARRDGEAAGRPRGGPRRARSRALVKIQDGCDNACTFCIIHVARGAQRSRPAGEVLAEVQARVAAGYQEIVLTGVHIGAYGRDRSGLAGPGLWSLVERLLRETGVARLRLSSIEPWDLDEAAFHLWQDPRLCPHLHLPLQSGCDETLRRMGRRSTAERFARLVAAARQAIPDLAVTTDVIVGFPGESEEQSAASLAFVEAQQFARVHVFPFSLRPGTPAAVLPGPLPPHQIARRAAGMRGAAAESERRFQERFLGRTLEVLWEAKQGGEGIWGGLTGNYLRVRTACPGDLHNRRTRTRLVTLGPAGLWGEIDE